MFNGMMENDARHYLDIIFDPILTVIVEPRLCF